MPDKNWHSVEKIAVVAAVAGHRLDRHEEQAMRGDEGRLPLIHALVCWKQGKGVEETTTTTTRRNDWKEETRHGIMMRGEEKR